MPRKSKNASAILRDSKLMNIRQAKLRDSCKKESIVAGETSKGKVEPKHNSQHEERSRGPVLQGSRIPETKRYTYNQHIIPLDDIYNFGSDENEVVDDTRIVKNRNHRDIPIDDIYNFGSDLDVGMSGCGTSSDPIVLSDAAESIVNRSDTDIPEFHRNYGAKPKLNVVQCPSCMREYCPDCYVPY